MLGAAKTCFIGEWASFQKIVDARPLMIGILDGFREHLEDLGGGLGLTDPFWRLAAPASFLES